MRAGVIAKKLGMVTAWNEWGYMIPLTILEIQDCQVVQVKTPPKEPVCALQIGTGIKKLRRTTKQMMGHFARADVPPKRKLWEFKVTPDAILPVGTEITCRHFLPGQKVDVCAFTKGKGTQGVMRRWGFGGQPASHGTSLAHRSSGSIGARKDPGKVWKGKKMAGKTGNKRRTIKNLFVHALMPQEKVILVKGAVPGRTGCWVRVTDAKFYKFTTPPPFPTFKSVEGEEEADIIKAEYPKPWPTSLEEPNALSDEEYKRLMTDPEYRRQKIPEILQEFLDQHGGDISNLRAEDLSLHEVKQLLQGKGKISFDPSIDESD